VSAARGVLAGTLGLSLLQAFLSSPTASSNAGTLFGVVDGVVKRLMDPAVPLVPDLRPTK
jgi:hypothetical protein